MKVRLLRSLGALAFAWIVGCEREYGIYRTAVVAKVPDLECTRRVLQATPGVTSVKEFRGSEESRSDAQAEGDHLFFYEGSRVQGDLVFIVEETGAIRFVQSLVKVNEKPPQDMIDATRAVMRMVEQRLEVECEMGGLSSAVQETCLRVKCAETE